MAIHSSILIWKTPWTRGAWQATVHAITRVGQDLATKHKFLYTDGKILLFEIYIDHPVKHCLLLDRGIFSSLLFLCTFPYCLIFKIIFDQPQ